MQRALKNLEGRIAALEEYLKDKIPNEGADDALLSKKPLGWSCASCQKNLINIEGMRVQYYPWAKLPQRNPAERIARVGQGFSWMLSMIKPKIVNKSGYVKKKGFDEEQQFTIEEEEARPMGRSHGNGFTIGAEITRPNTTNIGPRRRKVIQSIIIEISSLTPTHIYFQAFMILYHTQCIN